MPNAFAYFVLFSWPVVVFFFCRNLQRPEALIWAVLGGYLVLPYGVGVDLPVLPLIDKTLIPAFSALVFLPFAKMKQQQAPPAPTFVRPSSAGTSSTRGTRGPEQARRPGSSLGAWIEGLFLLLVIGTPALTVIKNGAPYIVGPRVLPGLTVYDSFSMILSVVIALLPYLLGRAYLNRAEDHLRLLVAVAVAGLLYSLPVLFEARMSPQLSRWTYGFLAQSFAQAFRDGGYRPVVFLQHGLWLAIFLTLATLAAFTLWRRSGQGTTWLFAGMWLLVTLAVCHSLGALAIAIAALLLIIILPGRIQMFVIAAVVSIIMIYPMLRGASLIPVEQLTSLASFLSTDRGDSLAFRLSNEDLLLAHANASPLVGWGGWGRSRVYDTLTGGDISTTDGMWIITVGTSGWLGYIGQFGLLSFPIILTALQKRSVVISSATSGLCILLAANLVDMIPNATLTPVTWLIAGAIAGSMYQSTR